MSIVPVVRYEDCWAKTTPDCQPGMSVRQHGLAAGFLAKELVSQVPAWLASRLCADAAPSLAALHDTGKLCPGFLGQCPAWCARHGIGAALALAGQESDHAKVGQRAIQEWQGDDSPLGLWAIVVGAHHGRLKGEHVRPLADGGPGWADERRRFIAEILRVFGPLPDRPPPGPSPWQASALWYVAGLVTVADWLASDEQVFPPAERLADDAVRERAAQQIEQVGFRPLARRHGLVFADLFPRLCTASPLQTMLADAATVPGVYVVEGPMGCGKTEAALLAAYGLLASGQATGLYFALPTQTTSNRIHLRVSEFLERLDPDARTRLIHANSWLLSDCAAVLAREEGDVRGGESTHDGRDWFASSRRALLAPFGVGTVDQALLAVVAAKHFAVRQFALAGKVVVLDEVHSYDVYTGTLVTELVRRLRDLGSTVVILSATLTAARRRELLDLADTAPVADAYPLVSARREDEASFVECPVPAGPAKTVRVVFARPDDLTAQALAKAEGGQCVLWVRNTVAHAQETYRRLLAERREGGPPVALLHARFPLFRRERLEAEWMEALGKDHTKRPPNGCVLLATQVAEQSVDIDADLLVTDLAPTDMLLQRSGRLWRHERPRPAGARCEAWIAAPDLDDSGLRTATAAELKAAFGTSARVYAPYVLVRTLAEWQRRTALALPTDIRPLLEATYAETADEPPGWRELHTDLETRRDRLRQAALASADLWQVQLGDEEGVQTRWNSAPSVALLPVPELLSWDSRRGAEVGLLDGSRCELRPGEWQFRTAKAVHRNLVRVPRWTVPASVRQGMSLLRGYIHQGAAMAKLLPDGRLVFLPGGQASCLEYRNDLGVVVCRDTPAAAAAWAERETDDDESDW